MIKKLLILSIIILLFGHYTQAINTEFTEVQNYTISDGLCQNGVSSILEDSRGFLWIGTYDGLSRYDGYSFKNYRNTREDKPLISNRIRVLFEDEKGNIWIGSDDGVMIYDNTHDKLSTIYSNKLDRNLNIKGPAVIKIFNNTKNKQIYCLTERNGILVFNNNYQFVDQVEFNEITKSKSILCHDAVHYNDSHFIISTSQGLIKYRSTDNNLSWILKDKIPNSISIGSISDSTFILESRKQLIVIDRQLESNNEVFTIRFRKKSKQAFRRVIVDNNNSIWISMINSSLYRIDNFNNLQQTDFSKIDAFQTKSSKYSMSCILDSKVRKGEYWIGSFDKGLIRLSTTNNPFKEVSPNTNKNLKKVNRLFLFDHSNDKIFVRINFNKSEVLDTKTGKFEKPSFKFPNNNQFLNNLFIDSKQNTIFRLSGSKPIYYHKKNSDKIDSLKHNFDIIKYIQEDRNGDYWLVSNALLYRVRLNNNNEILEVDSMPTSSFNKGKTPKIRCIYPDPHKNQIWIGTSTDGLFRINTDVDKTLSDLEISNYRNNASNPKSISSNFISQIIRLPNKQLFVGTERGGICEITENEDTLTFNTYSEKEGISNNVVKRILCDKNNNLWISTNNGLNKFNTETKTFRTFKVDDGLPFDNFLHNAIQLNNGTLVFNGQNSFFYFQPEDIIDSEPLPLVAFGDLKILNTNITSGDTINNRILLKERLDNIEKIELKYDENYFSIEALSLHFSSAQNHKIRYRLLPDNKEWTEASSDKKDLSFSGLPPGEYELNIMASNSIDQWTKVRKLQIVIKPPFWKTKLAYLLYIIVLFGAIYLIIIIIKRIQALKHDVELDELEIANVKSINAAKLRFFSNISHEIKTPLTLISGPIDDMFNRYQGNKDISSNLQLVQRQSKKITQLIDQVHDFQKADQNLLKMNYTSFSFNDFISEIIIDFNYLAKLESKTFKISAKNTPIIVSADKEKIEKIINNILSNAFKYTAENDTIELSYGADEGNLLIAVNDTGRGIDKDDLPHIFEMFYQSQKKYSSYIGGSGVGLAFSKRLVEMHYGFIKAESELKEGTSLTIQLPILTSALTDEQSKLEETIIETEKNYIADINSFDASDDIQAPSNPDSKKLKIYLVEDNTDLRKFVAGKLSEHYDINEFSNGQECLHALDEEWPDIIVSDLLMPELNGLELCKAIKSDIRTCHIPIILLTACTTIDDQIKGINEGADAYITKPFDMRHLSSRINGLLQTRKKLSERYQVDLPLSHNNNKENDKDNAFLVKLYKLIEENLDNQEMDVDSFAKELCLSRTNFYKKIKSVTEQTPYDVLKNYRLKRSAEMLVEGEYTVNEVFAYTGFKSRSHFSRLFKERYDTTPGKYAIEIRNKLSKKE